MNAREHVAEAEKCLRHVHQEALDHERRTEDLAEALVHATLALAAAAPDRPMAISVVFDGPPGPVSGRFVELELDDGSGVDVGTWIDRGDGTWVLRISALPVKL